jgi:hypothetical protein
VSDNTSINDLLRHEDEAPAPARPSGAAELVKTVGYAAALAALAELALRVTGLAAPYLLAFTAALALLVLRRMLRPLAPPPPARRALARRASDRGDESTYVWGAMDGLRSAVSRWESRLEWAQDRDRFARSARPRLAELVDERLRQRHGINRAADPDAARAALGEPLWAFLHGPAGRPPTPRELAALVTRMEEL